VDVLADEAIRQGIKEYASWPTIPQLYIKGEFVGAPTSCAKCMSPAN
jgi:monothiol glutaredoxin